LEGFRAPTSHYRIRGWPLGPTSMQYRVYRDAACLKSRDVRSIKPNNLKALQHDIEISMCLLGDRLRVRVNSRTLIVIGV